MAVYIPSFPSLYPTSTDPTAGQVASNISNLPQVGGVAQGINAINLGYQAGAIPNYTGLTGNVSEAAAHLLNPLDAQANYDVSVQGAELAAARGIPGSGAAAETTGRIRQADIERRTMLGNQLLTSQVQRLPTSFNPATQLINPSQISAQESALLRQLIARGSYGGGARGPRDERDQRVLPPAAPVAPVAGPQPLALPGEESLPGMFLPTGTGYSGEAMYGDALGGLTPEEYGASIAPPVPAMDYGGLTPDEYAASIDDYYGGNN